MESTRLKKVERLLQKELSTYFQLHLAVYGGRLVTVTAVRLSPDLSIAKTYLSIFPNQEVEKILALIENDGKKIKFEIGKITRNQMRKIPDFRFYIDDSLDHAQRIDDLLK